MKKLIVSLICLSIIAACKKNNNSPTINVSMIQYTWNLISENGEALRYVGTAEDYYNFSADGMLYKYVGKTFDTSAYTFRPSDSVLLFYQITNGIKSTSALSYKIKNLTNSQFVLSYSNGIIFSVDSLKR